MKATFVLQDIQKNISFLNHGLSTHSQLPVLSNVLVEARNNELKLSVTDLEIGIETQIPAKIELEGRILLLAKPLFELLNSLPSQKNITIQTQEKSLILTTEKTKSKMQTSDPEEFPSLYEEKGIEIAVLKQEMLQKELQRVVFAASSDTSRPALSGVLIKMMDKQTVFVATDGYRLSFKKTGSDNSGELEREIIIPARAVREVLMFKDEGDISVFVSKKINQIIFSQKGRTLVGKLIDSKFPEYEKIIPADFETRVFFDREEMLSAVKTSAIFARDANGMIRFSVKKDSVVVSANSPSVGENRVEVEARVEGEENEIAFNPRYVSEILSNMDDEEIIFEMTGPLNPGVFKVKDDPSFLHLIMPIRVQG